MRRTIVRLTQEGVGEEKEKGCSTQEIIDMRTAKIQTVMTQNPKFISPDVLAADAIALMEEHLITVLPVIDEAGKLCGIVHLHDLLGKGEFKFLV